MGERSFNRQERRAYLGVSRTRASIRRKTGAPTHFLEWKAVAAAKRLLDKTQTLMLTKEKSFNDKANAGRIAVIAERYPSLGQLAQAKRVELLALPGIGDATLRRLEGYLAGRGVRVNWALASADA